MNNTHKSSLDSRSVWLGLVAGFGIATTLFVGFAFGYFFKMEQQNELANLQQLQENRPDASDADLQKQLASFLDATATDSGSDLAVATGLVDDQTEGIFFLDFKTGDLQCWIYYPRQGKFGGKVTANVSAHLPSGKNADFLLVTGQNQVRGGSSNSRPAASIVYVVDVNSGAFAAYSFPWSEAAQNSGQVQALQFTYLGGGKVRG